jgi:hypothetical protein
MKSHTMNDIDTTPPIVISTVEAEQRNLTPMVQRAWQPEIFRLRVSIEPQVFTSHTAEYPLEMTHGRHLAIRKFSCKKDCEEMISIFSQSLSVIAFRYPHAGRTFASILPPAIYIPQT